MPGSWKFMSSLHEISYLISVKTSGSCLENSSDFKHSFGQGFWYFARSRTREIQVFLRIPLNSPKNAKYRENCQKYFQILVGKTYFRNILAIRPVLFTPNVQIGHLVFWKPKTWVKNLKNMLASSEIDLSTTIWNRYLESLGISEETLNTLVRLRW